MSRISIRYAGPILFVVPVLAAVAAMAALASWQVEATADDLVGQVVDQATSRVEQRLDADLSQAVRLTDEVALMIAEGVLDPGDLRSWRPDFRRKLNAFRAVNSLTFGTPEGSATWVIRYPGEPGLEYAIKDEDTGAEIVENRLGDDGTIGERIGSYAFDPRGRPWYEAAIDAGGPTWSAIYPWVRGDGGSATIGIAFARPIRAADGQLLGVLGADVALDSLSGFLARVGVSESGQAMLVGPNGALIAASAAVPVLDDDGDRVPAVEAGDPLLRDAARLVASEAGSFGAVDRRLRYRLDRGGSGARVEVEPLENSWDLDWRTLVIVPERDVMGGVAALRRHAWLVGALIALGALALGVLASQAMVRPVLGITEAVQAMGDGDLDHRVEVDGGREFVDLSGALNRMAADLKDRLRVRHSLALAMEIQQRLLPASTPRIPGLEIAGHSTYCDETGGDYYDFLELDETAQGDLVVVLGDVMGHGIAAALLMATARGVLRSRATDPGSLGQLLTHVNRQLEADTGGERFMTMILLVVDARERSIRWASAGHDAPIVYDPSADEFLELPEINGLPLGVMDDSEYGEASHPGLPPGALVLVGTDGIWETRDPVGDEYGKPRLCEIIRRNRDQPVDRIAESINAALRHYRGDAEQDDDITFVLARLA